MQEKIKAIRALLASAKEENEFGGNEDSDGSLHPGDVCWGVLEDRIIAVLEDKEYIAPESRPMPVQGPESIGREWVNLNSLPIKE